VGEGAVHARHCGVVGECAAVALGGRAGVA